ncbi:MAG TPA: protein kinase [Candidatus Babeliales bacterium]|jgi:serine/threonine protein kinase/Tfp pilus assembly protein PilF|nr:protein kinase [Candidatus Babeliales bacterium]
MTPARFQTIERIFLAAVEQEPDQVGAFLDTACEGDPLLRPEVEALLASDKRAGPFIERSTVDLTTRIIENRQAHSLVGQTIGHYKISESIGTGGMGEVYLATDIVARRKAALKLLPLRFTSDAERLKRFQQEARAVVGLNHPNILTIYEIGEDHSIHYIASELIEGETLRDRLTHAPMQVSEALDVAIQIASALTAAHQTGIVHRDIKPENIMLRPDGYVKVLDFGIAKLVEQELPTSMPKDQALLLVETNLGSVLGTVRYMSPEQARGGHVDKSTDIWSLGVVLYEMVSGRAPFSGDTPKEVMASILEKEPPPVTRHFPRAPAKLQQIVSKTLRKDPAQRYRNAAELLHALKELRRELEFKLQRAAAPLWLRWARSPVALVVVLLSAALALTFPFFQHRNVTTSSLPPDKSIAVLPFLDLSEKKDQGYFCDGMSEEIIGALAKVEGLRVVARTSSFSFKGKNVNASDVGKKLNVANVLEGSLRRESNRVRVTAELINTSSGFHVWTETYDRELAGVLALQDEITRSIVNALKIKLAVALPAQQQRNTEVYDLYLQGLYFSNKSSESDLRRALNFFQRAVEKDPGFSRAWTGIAKVWYFLADVYVKPLDAYAASKEAALKTIALDEKDAEAHCYLSEAKRVLDWDLAGADAELKRALELDPNSAPAHLFSGLHPLFRGELKKGLELIVEAEKLDPVSPIISYVATAAYLANDRIDDSVIEGQRTLQLDPNYFYLDSVLAAAYRDKGNFPEAIKLYTKAQEATHLPSSGLAITYARMSRQAEARNILAQLVQARETRYVSAPLIAAVSTALGDKEEAFRWLERAHEEHSGILQWIAFLPEFRALHSDVRFPDLVRRINASQDTILKITETSLSETADPNARSHYTLKVGVKPRPGTQNGHVVRISVSFYDLTKDNRMKRTDAQVGYDWLTFPRDWTDSTPKFLAATYVRPIIQTPSSAGRRYGGYIVRVYFDGQLQDSRATPTELLTLFPAEDHNAAPSPLPQVRR